MTSKKSVLSVGLQPQLINFADPAYAAFPGMTADKVQGGLDKDIAALNALGYDAKLCLTDFGETAEAVIRATLQQHRYDCVVIGAGVRTIHGAIRHGCGSAALVRHCLTHFLDAQQLVCCHCEPASGARSLG